MRKSFKVYFILALCLMLLASLSSCKSDEQKAMEKQIKTANKLLSSKSKIFDESTRSNLKKVIKDSENSANDKSYKKSTDKLKAAIKACRDSIKQQKQVTRPSQKFIIERVSNIESIVQVEAATEETDTNNLMNKPKGYYAYIALSSSMVPAESKLYSSPVENGNEGGGAIEVYKTAKLAKARDAYLSTFDSPGALSPGTHRVVGTMVVRTSSKLKASQQRALEKNIIDALIKLK